MAITQAGTGSPARYRLPVARLVTAVLVVFLVAALAQSTLHARADRTRRTELALSRIQSKVLLVSLLQQRALDYHAVAPDVSDELAAAHRDIRASVAELPDGQLDEVRTAVASHRRAVDEHLALVEAGELDQAILHDRWKVDPWAERLGHELDVALARQRAVAARTERLTQQGSMAALLLACVTVGAVLWRFERARKAAATIRERVLEESEARFRALVQNSSDIITVVDADGVVTYSSEGMPNLVGARFDALVAGLVHADDRDTMRRLLRAALEDPARVHFVEFRARADDGDWHVFESSARSALDDPTVRGIIITSRDITERKGLEERLRHQAFHDSLTNLPNRALLLDRLHIALARRAHALHPLAVLLLDLDGFKRVNDSLGHAAGDDLLVEVAARLKGCVRDADSVARLGGDEFAILLEELADADEAERVAERMLRTLAAPILLGAREIFIHASIGIVVTTAGEQVPEELLRDADVAMYAAKSEGKNRAKRFEPVMRAMVLDRVTLEGDLRTALDEQQIAVFYQPIVDLDSGRVGAMEALARWDHPTRGVLPPSKFIPIAEETGLIVPIGRAVLEEACRQLKQWQELYPSSPPLGVSVNLSGRQVQERGLVSDIRRVLARHDVEPSSLTLEITESVLMEHLERITGTLEELRALGVRLAIDDFGTGYSSLGYLQTFPIEVLKIDRSFVANVARGPEDSALARAVVKLAHTLDLGIVAEGVETPEQLERLRELGCPRGQGALFACPLSATDMEELLRATRAARHPPTLAGVR